MIYPVLILSGGLGSRLGKLTINEPKAMMNINNKPFIYHQLKFLSKNGIKDVIICIGYLGKKIKSYLSCEKKIKMNIKFSIEKKPLGTGGAIKKALSLVKKNFFILYGDTYLQINLKNVQKKYQLLKSNSMITIYKNCNKLDKSNIFFEKNNLIYNKIRKNKKMTHIDYGLSVFNKNFFKSLCRDKTKFDLSEIFASLSNKKKLDYYLVKKRFFEIGSIQSLRKTREYFKNAVSL